MHNIEHNAEKKRYELFVDGELATIADYRPDSDRLVFNHTETFSQFRGQGLAAELIRWALDDVRKKGLSVVPQCWFVAEFIEEHPEYKELVAA